MLTQKRLYALGIFLMAMAVIGSVLSTVMGWRYGDVAVIAMMLAMGIMAIRRSRNLGNT